MAKNKGKGIKSETLCALFGACQTVKQISNKKLIIQNKVNEFILSSEACACFSQMLGPAGCSVQNGLQKGPLQCEMVSGYSPGSPDYCHFSH